MDTNYDDVFALVMNKYRWGKHDRVSGRISHCQIKLRLGLLNPTNNAKINSFFFLVLIFGFVQQFLFFSSPLEKVTCRNIDSYYDSAPNCLPKSFVNHIALLSLLAVLSKVFAYFCFHLWRYCR